MDPPHCAWSWINLDPGIQESLIIAIAWAKHHAVLAKRNRLPVSIRRYVPDCEKGHLIRQPVSTAAT
jgi:hypothetical protein